MQRPGITFLLALTVAGCSGATPATSDHAVEAPGSSSGAAAKEERAEIELRFDEVVEHRELEFRWLDLKDSRCPVGVQCVWAGQIAVTIEVVDGEGGPVEVELVLRLGSAAEVQEVFGVELALVGVEPHPKQGQTPERETYVARIEIAPPQ